MRFDKQKAYKLRLSGKSYTEIKKALGIPKATLSTWFNGLILSDKLKNSINRRTQEKSLAGLIERNQRQTTLAQERARRFRIEASTEVGELSSGDLLLLGSALYWAEGYKRPIIRNGKEVTHHKVSLTNSDVNLVKLFLRFLREYCDVPEERIRASLRAFRHQNAKELQGYWQRETKIRPENFGKIYFGISKSSLGKRPFNRLPHGVIQVTVADTKLFYKIMGYIDGLKRFV